MKQFTCFVFVLAAGAMVLARDVSSSPMPPLIIHITREAVKPGKTQTVLSNRASAVEALAEVKSNRIVLGMRSITGPEEVWLLAFHDSLGSIEDAQREIRAVPDLMPRVERLDTEEGDWLLGKTGMTVLHQKDLSYRPAFDWSEARYLDVISVHVRPGHHLEYLEMRRMARAGHERGGLDTHLIVYKVTSGAPGVAFLILRPLRSLHEHDALRAKDFGEPMSEEDNLKMVRLLGESVDHEEEAFFEMAPRASHVTRSWAGTNAAFWLGSAK